MIAELAFVAKPLTFVVSESDEQFLSPVVGLSADRQPAAVYLASLGQASRRTQGAALKVAATVLTGGACTATTLPWWALRRQHINALRTWLAENRKPATANRILTAVRCVLKECWRLEYMGVEEYHRAIDVKAIAGSGPDQAAGRAILDGEKAAILAACRADEGPAGPRDAVIFGLATYAGLRRSEIAGLRLADYNADTGVLLVRGKGNKARMVPLTSGLIEALGEWLAVCARLGPVWSVSDGAGASAAEPLFRAINKGGRILRAGISDAAVYDVMLKYAQRAGVKHFSPHDGRRTAVGDLLDAGVDTVIVSKLVGHSDVNTTAGYDRRGERAKAQAVSRLHMRWERRG